MKNLAWKNLFTFTVLGSYFYVFMEWLFFVTKPSFMDFVGWEKRFEILFFTGFAVALPCGIFLLVFAIFDLLISRYHSAKLPVLIGTMIPAGILTSVSLLLIDNFTYTIFKFGIVSTVGAWRAVYGLSLILLFIYIYSQILKASGMLGEPKAQRWVLSIPFFFASGLLVLSTFFVLVRIVFGYFDTDKTANRYRSTYQPATRPDILLLGGDGLSASHLSVYGYDRDTTPTLRKLALTSLLAENVFSNSAHSSGSVISILTSKLPTQTRVLYPPDILKGEDVFEHLPGILKKAGYYNVEIGVPNFVDAHSMQLLDGFDIVNQRHFNNNNLEFWLVRGLDIGLSGYFASQLVERLSTRILHLLFIQKMENSYSIVTQPAKAQSEREQLEQLLELIQDSDRPLFVHMHMMVTHGPRFNPEIQLYSSGEIQDKNWMRDFYDDGILNFDRYIGEVLGKLEETGKLNNTIVIIYSDHAMKYDVRVRIPLILHFPGNEYSGRIQNNVQNLDIAPSILDYLGIPIPKWMGGQSLLNGNPSKHRLIFSAATSATMLDTSKGILNSDRVKPPFYQFALINAIDCDNLYRLDLHHHKWISGKVAGHTSPCDGSSMLNMEQAKAELSKHLSSNGFDVATLP